MLAWALTALATVAVLAGCGGTATHTRSTRSTAAQRTAPQAPASGVEAALLPGGIPKVVARVAGEVVTVITKGGVGSGVIYRSDGVILTNNHVVEGSAEVRIQLADGQILPGRVTASDPDTDLALVRVDRRGLPAASFQTALPPVGALAIVIGSPLGFENTVTAGIVSGLHRSIPGSAQESSALVDLMQTDAPISPGNSGGAVVDAQGKVIGISDAYIPPQQGAVAIGFAIPAATAVSVADQLLQTGHVKHAFIGIEPAQLTPELAAQLGLHRSSGVIVYGVAADGPAARAHIAPGDILTAIDGQPLPTVEELFTQLRRKQPGQSVRIELDRNGKRLSVDVRLADRPQ